MSELPSGFYRAEAAWLEPREYQPSPDDAAEDILRLCRKFSKMVADFTSSWFTEVEDSGQVEETITALKDLIRDIEDIQEEMEDAEEIVRHAPDPDEEWDTRGVS